MKTIISLKMSNTSRQHHLTSSAFCLLLLSSSSAFAQTTEHKNSPQPLELQTITIDSNRGNVPTNIPSAVTVINSTTISRELNSKLDNLLRETPGTFTTMNASNPGIAVNIRGFEGSGRVNMMLDGVPQNFRQTAHDAQGYAYIDPNLLSSIEIKRGAVTTEGGSGLAGNVNFRTLGVDDVLREGRNTGILGRASWGSNGVGFSEMLAGAMRADSAAIVAAISRRDSNDYKNGYGDIVDKTGQKLTSGLIKTEFGFAEDQKLVLGGVFYNNHYGTHQRGFGNPPFIQYDLFLQNRTLFANYEYAPLENDFINLAANIYYNRSKLSYTGGNGSNVGRIIDNDTSGFTLSNTSRFQLGEFGLSWKYGIEASRDNTGGHKVGVNPASSKSNKMAGFTEALWTYQNLQILTGLRYDYFKLTNKENSINNSDNALSPQVTLAYDISHWLQPYVTYSHSMRAPTLQETMLGGNAHGGNMKPNPDLLPEKQKGWELGFNIVQNSVISSDDHFTMKANYYHMRVEDYITAAADFSQFINVEGTSTVKGFELQANYDTGYVFGEFAYTHAISNLPKQVAGLGANQYLPRNIFTLMAGGRFLEQRLEAGAKFKYVSSGKSLDGNNSKPYQLVDLFANYKLKENIDLSLQVENLFNKKYTPALSTYGSGQGRTFKLATEFQF